MKETTEKEQVVVEYRGNADAFIAGDPNAQFKFQWQNAHTLTVTREDYTKYLAKENDLYIVTKE